MANQFLNIITFLMSLIIAETVIASPLDRQNEDVHALTQVAIKSMNDSSPSHHFYRYGRFSKLQRISAKDEPPIVKITVQLEPYCIEESPCSEEVCSMLISEDESNNLVVDEQSKECKYLGNQPNAQQMANYYVRKEPTNVDVNDPIVQTFVRSATSKYREEHKIDMNMFVTRMINATMEGIPGGSKYVIYIVIVEPTCVKNGSSSTCLAGYNSPTKLCRIDAEYNDKIGAPTSGVSSTCHSE